MTEETDPDDSASLGTGRKDTNEITRAEFGFEHPTTVSVDDSIGLTITGIAVDTVDVRVVLAGQSDRDWESNATYDTPDGRLDLESATSTNGGTTGGITDLIQRATPAEGSDPYEPGRDGDELTVHVEYDGQTLGSTTIERTFGSREITSEAVTSESIVGRIYEPPGGEPAPAVVVLHGSDGTPADGIAQLLASHGFVALAMQYFDWQGRRDSLPAELVEVPLETVENAVEWVRERNSVRGRRGTHGIVERR